MNELDNCLWIGIGMCPFVLLMLLNDNNNFRHSQCLHFGPIWILHHQQQRNETVDAVCCAFYNDPNEMRDIRLVFFAELFVNERWVIQQVTSWLVLCGVIMEFCAVNVVVWRALLAVTAWRRGPERDLPERMSLSGAYLNIN